MKLIASLSISTTDSADYVAEDDEELDDEDSRKVSPDYRVVI